MVWIELLLSWSARQRPTTGGSASMSRRGHCSRRQLLAGLLPDDVLGVPIRPVRIVLAAGSLLVLAMRRRRTSERGGEVGRRGECRVRIHASRQSRGDLLE